MEVFLCHYFVKSYNSISLNYGIGQMILNKIMGLVFTFVLERWENIGRKY